MSRLLLSLAVLAALCAGCAAGAKPKHVIFMLIDDLGFADVGYKATTYPNVSYGFPMPTPTIDKWAMNGVRLEQYYVHQLCSPTRTALLSGRYAYSIGQEGTVIVDGHPEELNLNISTMADHLQKAGWATSAYGKWDAGMTSWGCTPQCRGFDYFAGFFNADEDHLTHMAGAGLDLRNGWGPDLANNNESDVYSVNLFTSRVQEWITKTITADPTKQTFAYVAHQAIHAPQEVPERYIAGECSENIPKSNPTRTIVCGMMKAVDESLANITATYEKLGILEDTVILFSADNGGNQNTGGSNHPLRGAKATVFEGGVRGVGWASGAGLQPASGSVSHQMMHVSDWYPTIVEGIAGLPLKPNPGTPPFDGMNMWPTLTDPSAASPRDEILLDLQPTSVHGGQQGPTKVLGLAALRKGKWKLIRGHPVVWAEAQGGSQCATRNTHGVQHHTFPLPVTDATAPPFCPSGWTPPPSTGMDPVPPSELNCTSLPCSTAGTRYDVGGTWLFDLEEDPLEKHDLSSTYPDVLAAMMARLEEFNATNVPQVNIPTDPLSNPARFGGVWTPWRGDPVPQHCSKNVTGVHYDSTLDRSIGTAAAPHMQGWVWSSDVDNGLAPLVVTGYLDGHEVATGLANITRPQLHNMTGAPNNQHGFSFPLPGSVMSGRHIVSATVDVLGRVLPITNSPMCWDNGKKC